MPAKAVIDVALHPTAPRSEVVLLEPRDRAALDGERTALLAEVEPALPIAIGSPGEYQDIATLEARLGRFIDKAEPLFDEHCSAAHRVWKSACQIRSLFLDGPKALKARARQLLSAYVEFEQRQRRDEERRLAEAARQEALAQQKREAKLLERQGQPEIAAAIRAQPVDAPAVVLPSTVPDVGLTYREDWTWAPVGGDTPANRARALALMVRPEWLTLVKFDDAGLTAFARRTKGTIRVPGIVFRPKQIPVRR